MDKTFVRSYTRVMCLIGVGLFLLFLDFFSKAFVYYLLTFNEGIHPYLTIPVFKDLIGVNFEISPTMNKGAAWGMLADFQVFLLVLRIAIILAIFLYLFLFNRNRQVDFPLMLILTGAIGNVIDYFLYGHVVDFLHFSFEKYHFAVFNFADVWITAGVIWLLLLGVFTRKNISQKSI